MDLKFVRPGEADVAAWLRWRNEPNSRAMNPIKPATVEELTARLRAARTDLTVPASEYRWMLRLDSELVGTVSAFNISWPMGYGEIGYMIAQSHQRKRLGTRAVTLLVEKLFRETNLHRIFATVSVDNVPSCRILERLGFKKEGVLREHFRIQGERVDEAVFGLLRPEWEARALNRE